MPANVFLSLSPPPLEYHLESAISGLLAKPAEPVSNCAAELTSQMIRIGREEGISTYYFSVNEVRSLFRGAGEEGELAGVSEYA